MPESEIKVDIEQRRQPQEVSTDCGDIVCVSWDIETGPLSDDYIRQLMPEFVAPPQPGEFDVSSVKCGNLKDAAKIAAKIADARAAHEAAVRNYAATVEEMRLKQFDDFKASAALSATTGQVVAIGVSTVRDRKDGPTPIILGQDRDNGIDERQVLTNWWSIVERHIRGGVPMVGHNIHSFDLPFLVQRSWILGVSMPGTIMLGTGRRYWNNLFVDTMREWGFGDSRSYTKLDLLSKAFGFEGKTDGECRGENFYEFWFADDPAKYQLAVDYLMRDIELPAAIAMAMGVV